MIPRSHDEVDSLEKLWMLGSEVVLGDTGMTRCSRYERETVRRWWRDVAMLFFWDEWSVFDRLTLCRIGARGTCRWLSVRA